MTNLILLICMFADKSQCLLLFSFVIFVMLVFFYRISLGMEYCALVIVYVAHIMRQFVGKCFFVASYSLFVPNRPESNGLRL